MPDLTDSEAIEALFESTSGYLTFSPRIKSPKSDENVPPNPASGSSLPLLPNTPNPATGTRSPPLLDRRSLLNASQGSPMILHSPNYDSSNSFLERSSRSLPLSGSLSNFNSNSTRFGPQEHWSVTEPTSPILCHSISNFDLIGTVGCGSYGKVLLGNLINESTGSNRLRAIKVLRKHDMQRDGVEEVKKELRTLHWIADMTKPQNDTQGISFLQKMFESFQNEKFVFIVLEYHPVSLANPLIATRLKLRSLPSTAAKISMSKSKSLPISLSPESSLEYSHFSLDTLRLVGAELVLGLIFLHQRGIVHQDIKPSNIMISSAGHIIIADFGASTALPFSFDYEGFPVIPNSPANKTFHPIVLNAQDLITFTPLYAAPELVRRNRAGLVIYDSRADWWSFGVMLYELATESTPFIITPSKIDHRDGNEVRRKRRSLGDFSLMFGAMEELAAECNSDAVSQLHSFIRALLINRVSDRLSGEDAKTHSFFESISHLWHEIAALEHPPLPDPPQVPLDPDTSLDVALSPRIRSDIYMEDGQRSGSPLPRRPQESHYKDSLRMTWPKSGKNLDEDDPLRPNHTSNRNSSSRDEMVSSIPNMTSVYVDSTSKEVASASNSFSPSSDHEECSSTANSSGEDEVLEHETDDSMNSPVSPLQPFPSTASLRFVQLREEQDEPTLEMESPDDPALLYHDIENAISSRPQNNVVDESDRAEEEDTSSEDVEVWNPWVPRLPHAPLYPSDSWPSVLPNPYSPRLESVAEFQSFNSIPTFQPQDIVPVEPESTRKEDVLDIPSTSPARVFDARKSTQDGKETEDLLFFKLDPQSRRHASISFPLEGRKEEGKKRWSLSQFPPSASSGCDIIQRTTSTPAMSSVPQPLSSLMIGPKAMQETVPVDIGLDVRSSTNKRKETKKRFSLSGSFTSSDYKAKREKDQNQSNINTSQNPKRRFSAPLHFPSRGPPSSFDVSKFKLKPKPRSLLMLSRARSRPESSAPPSPPVGINVLPFPMHQLDGMRIEHHHHEHRATNRFPTPSTPRNRSTTISQATLGRSTGTKMMAQAVAMRRGQSDQGVGQKVRHRGSQSAAASWSPALQDELTMAVLCAMDDRDSDSQNFSITRSRSRPRARLEITTPTRYLQVSNDELGVKRGRRPALVPMVATAAGTAGFSEDTSRLRESWAEIAGPHKHHIISCQRGRGDEQPAQVCSSPSLVAQRENRREDPGDEEFSRGSTFKGPFRRPSTSHQRQPSIHTSRAQPSRHTSQNLASRRLHKQPSSEPGFSEDHNSDSVKGTTVAKRLSLKNRIWKRFRRLTSF